jgi:hypothetical protein
VEGVVRIDLQHEESEQNLGRALRTLLAFQYKEAPLLVDCSSDVLKAKGIVRRIESVAVEDGHDIGTYAFEFRADLTATIIIRRGQTSSIDTDYDGALGLLRRTLLVRMVRFLKDDAVADLLQVVFDLQDSVSSTVTEDV